MSGAAASNCVKNKLALLWRKALSNTFSFSKEEKKVYVCQALFAKENLKTLYDDIPELYGSGYNENYQDTAQKKCHVGDRCLKLLHLIWP